MDGRTDGPTHAQAQTDATATPHTTTPRDTSTFSSSVHQTSTHIDIHAHTYGTHMYTPRSLHSCTREPFRHDLPRESEGPLAAAKEADGYCIVTREGWQYIKCQGRNGMRLRRAIDRAASQGKRTRSRPLSSVFSQKKITKN